MFWAERPDEPTMYRRLLLLTCLAAALFVAPAAEAAPERRIDLAAAPYLAAAASAPAPVAAVECVQARAALHHGSRRKAICLVWTFDRSGEPGDHCLDATFVRLAKPRGGELKVGGTMRVMCGLAAPRDT
jgi:hypothetical protein